MDEEQQSNRPVVHRHPGLYFPQGTLTLQARDGTLYNVYRELLILKSDFFAGMLTIPIPGSLQLSQSSKDFIEFSRKGRLDGSSDETAVVLPDKFSAEEVTVFLEFVFNILPWSEDAPDLQRLCALMKTCDFFGAESGTRYAIHYLEDHPDLAPALRFRLAQDYQINSWAKRAFYELMSTSILEVSREDEATMGSEAYRALVRTQAAVAQYRLGLALFPPDAVHANFCYNNNFCGGEWARNWVGISGGLGSLLKDEMSGSEIHDALNEMRVPGMNEECRILTISSIQDTPNGKSLLKKEEDLIEEAVESLIKQW
ncbi:hypothetical protein DFH07DRAFT_1056285 [Mycena maculata]|uniref:BTB domain-containing protein n=1 Tax=Mycena maculata TaxID=230809 RepID=A0AAD7NWB9_9AGAR|nr:hypothetical protein DFH07DRAFT_1056285 [Mycena maculata]